MVFSVTEFLETPTVEEFELLKKDDLIGLGLHFKLAVKSSMRKQKIKVIVAKRLLQEEFFPHMIFLKKMFQVKPKCLNMSSN